MNTLIIGGLLGLAVLAILGAVLLGIGEDRAENAKKELQEQQTRVSPLFPQQSQSRQMVSQRPAYQSVPTTPLLPRQTITLPVSNEGEKAHSLSPAGLDGQVREIPSELRTLAQQAGELQQRLSILSEALERREQPNPEPPRAGLSTDIFTSDTETQVF